ncbi:MAG: thioredoxin family protein [Planctomycetota bacterium]|jgi:thioredoxin 1
MPVEINSEIFDQEVIQSDKPVLLDFWGPRCRPCLELSPQIDNLEKTYLDKVKIAKIDASKNRRLCLRLKVLSLPTFLVYKNGEEVGRLTGEVTIREVQDFLNKTA